MRGVNLAGAEFGEDNLPGVYGRDYTYNSEATFRYFAAKGLNLIRLCLRWERLQPVLLGPLDAENLGYLRQNLDWARSSGASVILDIHNFGRHGGAITAAADLADVWRRLSTEFRHEPVVYGYGLMCEPHDLGDADWKTISQTALMAIRRNGDEKLVLVPGDDWSSAYRWEDAHGPEGWIVDPSKNFRYEAHLYFDSDESGGYTASYDEELAHNPELPGIARTRLAPFLAWCRANGVEGFLGEYGVPDTDSRWLPILDDLLTALDDAEFDGTYWAAGEWWGDYPLSVQPHGNFNADRPQMAVLERHL